MLIKNYGSLIVSSSCIFFLSSYISSLIFMPEITAHWKLDYTIISAWFQIVWSQFLTSQKQKSLNKSSRHFLISIHPMHIMTHFLIFPFHITIPHLISKQSWNHLILQIILTSGLSTKMCVILYLISETKIPTSLLLVQISSLSIGRIHSTSPQLATQNLTVLISQSFFRLHLPRASQTSIIKIIPI